MDFPHMLRIRQDFDNTGIENVERHVAHQFQKIDFSSRTQPGNSVAIACSSRGIARYAEIVKATVMALSGIGLKPFLFPAMGSHGASTAEGQKQVLESYGLTEAYVGTLIRSSLETVQVGETPDGVPVLIDKLASKADHIVVINRVKSHTEFVHEFESGLMKMMTIGLGKQKGATLYHQAFMVYGYPHVIGEVARTVMGTGRILCGVGIVENGYAQTADIAVVMPEEVEEQEKKLLKMAKSMAPALPFDEADVLIIDEMGKDISGSGFDTKVVGRILMPLVAKEPDKPKIKRILVCDLTKKTAGNADGIGIADFVIRRLVDKIDIKALYVNALTGGEPEHAKIPLTMENDRDAIRVAIESVGLIPAKELKIIRIKNTLQLSELDVSTAYIEKLSGRSNLEIVSRPETMKFNDAGNLLEF